MQSAQMENALVSVAAPGSFAAEQYQALRLKIEGFQQSRGVRVLAVTSPGVSDGKTMTSINLAAALARGPNTRVLLIDADLRCPSVAKHLGLADDEGAGLAGAIGDDSKALADVVRQIDRPNGFAVVPAGSATAEVHELLRSPRFEDLLREARGSFEFIVLDTPPLVPVCDAALVSRLVDGTLVVVAAHETPRRLLGEALSLLDESKTLGIVFNGEDRPLFSKYNAYYRH
jgi:polysaccharide biosynthesis transport protein